MTFDNDLAGVRIVVTGKSDHHSRREIVAAVTRRGGMVLDVVIRHVDAVFSRKTSNGFMDSTKARTAQELGIPIFPMSELDEILSGASLSVLAGNHNAAASLLLNRRRQMGAPEPPVARVVMDVPVSRLFAGTRVSRVLF